MPEQLTTGCVIGIDWGSTNFRAFLVRDGRTVDTLTAGRGILFGERDARSAWLAATLAPWQRDEDVSAVLGIGMLGSRDGLLEAPYVELPARADTWALHRRSAGRVNDVPLWIYPGISWFSGALHDVMRGEEFLAFAVAEERPDEDLLVVCPGTHSKWISVARGTIESFRTHPSGELYALWAQHSSIAGSLRAELTPSGFAQGLELARAGEDLLPGLFGLRGGMLSGAIAPEDLRGALSGVVIGRELISGLRRVPEAARVLLIAPGELGDLYQAAFAAHDVPVERAAVDHGRAFARLAARTPQQRLVTE